MDLQLAGKTAIVTGGSGGLGKAIARALAFEGANVVICARDGPRLAAAAEELSRDLASEVTAVTCDTTSDASVKRMASEVVASFGRIDVLVNSAARPGYEVPRQTLSDLSTQVLSEEIDVKVMGYLRCIQAVAPAMKRHGSGRIINISGLAARQTGSTIGSIRNVAVAAMTKNLADELGKDGITLAVVHPGLARTDKLTGYLTQAEFEQRGSQNLLGRLIDASDIAHVVTFLASPLSIAINGDAVAVGGGIPGAIYY